jgi:hypothetical protein
MARKPRSQRRKKGGGNNNNNNNNNSRSTMRNDSGEEDDDYNESTTISTSTGLDFLSEDHTIADSLTEASFGAFFDDDLQQSGK